MTQLSKSEKNISERTAISSDVPSYVRELSDSSNHTCRSMRATLFKQPMCLHITMHKSGKTWKLSMLKCFVTDYI
jgi:hypothetical protein